TVTLRNDRENDVTLQQGKHFNVRKTNATLLLNIDFVAIFTAPLYGPILRSAVDNKELGVPRWIDFRKNRLHTVDFIQGQGEDCRIHGACHGCPMASGVFYIAGVA